MISLSGYWFLFFIFFSFFLSFLIKTCSVVNLIEHLPHKIHRNNFLLKKRLTPYIISGGARSRQGLRAPGSPLRPLSLHLISLIDPPISFIYGHVHRPIGTRFIIWRELQSMKLKNKRTKKKTNEKKNRTNQNKTLILMKKKPQKNQNIEDGRGGRRGAPLRPLEWRQHTTIWDGSCGGREKKETRHLLNQSLVVDKFSETSTWHH